MTCGAARLNITNWEYGLEKPNSAGKGVVYIGADTDTTISRHADRGLVRAHGPARLGALCAADSSPPRAVQRDEFLSTRAMCGFVQMRHFRICEWYMQLQRGSDELAREQVMVGRLTRRRATAHRACRRANLPAHVLVSVPNRRLGYTDSRISAR